MTESSKIPNKFLIPFAERDPNRVEIPAEPTDKLRASQAQGFPPLTMQPPDAGGFPPDGEDFNGAMNQVARVAWWSQLGGRWPYDSDFASSSQIGGYPKGSVLPSTDGYTSWVSLSDNNTTNPEADGGDADWRPLEVSGAADVENLSGGAYSLKPLEASKEVINLSGYLQSDQTIILPNWVKTYIFFNRCQGNFSLQLKTSNGESIKIPNNGSPTHVSCNGQSLNNQAFNAWNATTDSQLVTLGQVNRRFDNTQGDLQNLQNQVNDTNNNLNNQVGRIDGRIDDTNNNLNNQVGRIDGRIDDTNNNLNNTNNNLNNQVSRLDGRINDTNNNWTNRTNDLQNQINDGHLGRLLTVYYIRGEADITLDGGYKVVGFRAIGGGGSGGSIAPSEAVAVCGGGSAGAYVEGWTNGSRWPKSVHVSCGRGAANGDGGTTTIGDIIRLPGGVGGQVAQGPYHLDFVSAPTPGTGGVYVQDGLAFVLRVVPGGAGEQGECNYGGVLVGGKGADSIFGAGGASRKTAELNQAIDGVNTSSAGAGGGGGVGLQGKSTTGGIGGDGYVELYIYG